MGDRRGPVAAGMLLLACVAAMPSARGDDPAQAQRQQQIAQQARQMEQFFQPALQAELEIVRATCGGLSAEARRQIVAAGLAAMQEAARQAAAWQFGDRSKERLDARVAIHAAVAAAVKPQVAPEAFAAYEREHAARGARRGRTARILIVAKLDQVLALSAAQREAIEADLEKHWDPAWVRELDDNGGMRINQYRPAPDFADARIAPHLNERQSAEWKQWCQQAGWSRLGQHVNWHLDGTSLQPDPWWAP